jgi:hypothetical protein
MRISGLLICMLLAAVAATANADPQAQASQGQPASGPQNPANTQNVNTQNQSGQDVFSYSYLQVNRLSEWSDYFNDRSAGNGIKFSYGFDGGVYVFGEWARLDFQKFAGNHQLSGIGVGAHQQYNQSTSFYIQLQFLRDRLSGNLDGGIEDDYWRVDYGFKTRVSDYAALTGAIFTERNTDFGRRPFGERLGLSFGSSMLMLGLFGEHTANGNRVQAELNWYYK